MAAVAAVASDLIHISRFKSSRDNQPEPATVEWSALSEMLCDNQTRASKDGAAWSPASYLAGVSRGKAFVSEVSCLVIDVDNGASYEEFRGHWSKWRHIVSSSYSHTKTCPKYRVVFPLAKPVAGGDWEHVYTRLALAVGLGQGDPACKDASRLYYLPSCPAETKGDAFSRICNDAPLLDVALIEDFEDVQPAARSNGKATQLKPGDAYNLRATWSEVLEAHHWVAAGKADGGRRLWRRPGKNNGHSAIDGAGGTDLLYVFSSNAAPFQDGKTYSKFWAYALLDHGGDVSAAVRALSAAGFGEAMPTRDGRQPIAEPPTQSHFYKWTDTGNAERLLARFGSDLRYCHTLRRFYTWDGSRWLQDETGDAPAFGMAKKVVRSMYSTAAEIEGEGERKQFLDFAKSCESRTRLTAMVDLVKKDSTAAITPDELDAKPWFLNVANGTIDLKTGTLRESNRLDLLSKRVPIAYDPDADCPNWKRFVVEIMGEDGDLAKFLWRGVGYSLTGDVSEQCLFFNYGMGSNGKSTLMDIMLILLGDYGQVMESRVLMASAAGSTTSPEIARLKGARLVSASETGDRKEFDEAKLKAITGGDRISANPKYAAPFDFPPTHKLWLSGNHKPTIKGQDWGIWRRIMLIPFNAGPFPINAVLPMQLRQELPGILTWAVKGCLEWQSKGLRPPTAVTEAVEEYRKESDVLGDFLTAATVQQEGSRLKPQMLFAAYVKWCERTGVSKEFNLVTLGRKMREAKEPHILAHNSTYYVGRQLNPEYEPDTTAVWRGSKD